MRISRRQATPFKGGLGLFPPHTQKHPQRPQQASHKVSAIQQYNIKRSALIPHSLRLPARVPFVFERFHCRPAARNMEAPPASSSDKTGRTLVLAFDGTSNQFSDRVSQPPFPFCHDEGIGPPL